MPNTHTQGFTLIELLIVIAIIGILAVVLLPQLMAARVSAGEKAAQSFGSNVAKSAFAWLADNQFRTVADLPNNCGTAYQLTESNGNPSGYGWDNKPATVSTCEISADANGDLQVTVTSTYGETYINGR